MIDSNLYSYSRVRVRVEESYSSSQEALVGEVVFQSNCGLVEALATVSQPCLSVPHEPLCCRKCVDGSRTNTLAAWLEARSRRGATPCVLSISIDQGWFA
jgi:hypothetical protein